MRISDWSSDVCSSDLFDVPPSMVEAEFAQIWQQLEHEAGHEADPEAAKAELEAEREDYREIAVRRVRLGLLLSEIGQANGIQISAQEMNRLTAQAGQQYRPEDRKRFRSEEHTSELQSLMHTSYAVFCLKKKKNTETKK